MAIDSDDKLTAFYDSGKVIVTSEIANSWYGGLHDTSAADLLDENDPQVVGHLHDGKHTDGHCGFIDLVDHVTNQLQHENLGDGAVQANNIQCYPEAQIDSAIPIYEEIGGDRCYYLDLSLFVVDAAGEDEEVQYNEGGILGANSGFVYRYSTESLGIRVDDMDQNSDKALSVMGNAQIYDYESSGNPGGSPALVNGSFTGGSNWVFAGGFSLDGTRAMYSNDTGGTLTQTFGLPDPDIVGGRWYEFEYTISGLVDYGTISAVITIDFAELEVNLPLEDGTHKVLFKSNSAPTDFIISAGSADPSEAFLLDDVSLEEMQGGDLEVHGVTSTRILNINPRGVPHNPSSVYDLNIEDVGGIPSIAMIINKESISDGDTIGYINFGGTTDGVAESPMYYYNSSSIRVRADGDWDTFNADSGSKMQFLTTADGSSSNSVQVTIDGDGNVGINEESPQTLLHIAGDGASAPIMVESMIVVASPGDGEPVVWDSVTNEFKVDPSIGSDQYLWSTFTSDAGSVSADITTDTLTILGGFGISTGITGDTLTIENDAPNWLTIDSDAGSTVAGSVVDTLMVAGGTGISTSITGDTLTIVNDSPNVDQSLWLTIDSDGGSTDANSTTDTLMVAGGTGISTSITGDAVTIDLDASIDDLSDVDTTTVAPNDGDHLFWDSGTGTWVPDAPTGGGGEGRVQFFSQWTGTADWIQRSGGFNGFETAVYQFQDPSLPRDVNIRVLQDYDNTFYLTVAIPLNGDATAGSGDWIDGADEGPIGEEDLLDGSLPPNNPPFWDPVSGFPDDAPTGCRVTCYFVLNQGANQGAGASVNVDLEYGGNGDPSPMREYQDGDLIFSGGWSNIHNGSGTINMRNEHNYSTAQDGTLVVSDFSPVKIDTERDNGGLCTFRVALGGFGNYGSGQAFFQSGEEWGQYGFIGARLLWIWEEEQAEEAEGGGEVYGCTDTEALNYDPEATINDGTCQYEAESAQAIVVSPLSIELNEGAGNGQFTLMLAEAPTGENLIIVNIASLDTTAVTISPSVLNFDLSNWAAGQTVSVFPVDDADVLSEETEVVCSSEGLSSVSVAVTVADDDSADVTAPTVVIDDLDEAYAIVVNGQLLITATATDTEAGTIVLHSWEIIDQPAEATVTMDPDLEEHAAQSVDITMLFSTDTAGEYTLVLVVSDAAANQGSDSIAFNVAVANQAPTAGFEYMIGESVVTMIEADTQANSVQNVLIKSTSTDPDGDPLDHDWTASINDENINTAGWPTDGSTFEFAPPASPGTLTVELTVDDGTDNDSITKALLINAIPIANFTIETDGDPAPSNLVTLTSTSADSDGEIVGYAWTFSGVPEGSGVGDDSIANSDSNIASFTPDVEGNYLVRLIVTDNSGSSSTPKINTLTVIAANSPPVVTVDSAEQTVVDENVTLTATATDDDGDELSYDWTVESHETDLEPTYSFGDASVEDTTFTADVPGSYTLKLTVNDGNGGVASDEVTVVFIAANAIPVAVITGPTIGLIGQTLALSGASSADEDGEITSYTWTFSSKPGDSDLGDVDINTSEVGDEAAFVPDVYGDYVVQLVVNDGTDDSAPDTHAASIEDAMVVTFVFLDMEFNEITEIELDTAYALHPVVGGPIASHVRQRYIGGVLSGVWSGDGEPDDIISASPETGSDHPVGDGFPSAVAWKLILTSTLGHTVFVEETLSVISNNLNPIAVVEYKHVATPFVLAETGVEFYVPSFGEVPLFITAYNSTDQESTGGLPDINNDVIDLIYRWIFEYVPPSSPLKNLAGLTNPSPEHLESLGLGGLIYFGDSFEQIIFAPQGLVFLEDPNPFSILLQVEDPITGEVTTFTVLFRVLD